MVPKLTCFECVTQLNECCVANTIAVLEFAYFGKECFIHEQLMHCNHVNLSCEVFFYYVVDHSAWSGFF